VTVDVSARAVAMTDCIACISWRYPLFFALPFSGPSSCGIAPSLAFRAGGAGAVVAVVKTLLILMPLYFDVLFLVKLCQVLYT